MGCATRLTPHNNGTVHSSQRFTLAIATTPFILERDNWIAPTRYFTITLPIVESELTYVLDILHLIHTSTLEGRRWLRPYLPVRLRIGFLLASVSKIVCEVSQPYSNIITDFRKFFKTFLMVRWIRRDSNSYCYAFHCGL